MRFTYLRTGTLTGLDSTVARLLLHCYPTLLVETTTTTTTRDDTTLPVGQSSRLLRTALLDYLRRTNDPEVACIPALDYHLYIYI